LSSTPPAQHFRDLEEVRQTSGSPPHSITYGTLLATISRRAERLVARELVGEALAGRRIGAAVQAREVAVARELPGDEERRREAVDAKGHR
jgi:hypothetical protein